MARSLKADRIHRILLALAIALPAAVLAQTQLRDSGRITRYLIVDGDSSSGSWDSRDEPQIREWRSRYGSHFAWFRQDGHDYLVTGEATLDKVRDAMAPQLEVNSQQSEVNRHQGEVNRMQGEVNSHQKDVNRDQAEVNRQQSRANRGDEAQPVVNGLQSGVNAKQQEVNAEQQRVNREQEVVNKEQAVVNKMQTRANAEIADALQIVFDSARMQGLAYEVR